MFRMTVEEFMSKSVCNLCTRFHMKCKECSVKSDLRKVIEGLLPLKKFEGNIDWNDCIDYIRKRLDEELGGGR